MKFPMRLSSTNKYFCLLLLLSMSSLTELSAAESDVVAGADIPPPIEAKDYAPYPQPGTGYVTDHSDLLTWDEEEKIEEWLWQVEYRSGVEIIVVTIDSITDYPDTTNESIENFATSLFDTYGIGNMPKNDGILFLIAAGDRKARIELGGAWGQSRDSDAMRIMSDVIVPEFGKGDYASGITKGTETLISEFANMEVGSSMYIVWIGVAGFISLIIGISLLISGKKGWGYVFIGLAIMLLLLGIFLAVRLAQQMPKSGSGGWSSGGMGGFGGGFSGGGGATGGW
jgi:uncharacterized protein